MKTGEIIASLVVVMVVGYLWLTRGARTISAAQNQGWINAPQVPLYVSVPNFVLPTQPFNWHGFSPNDFLVTQDISA